MSKPYSAYFLITYTNSRGSSHHWLVHTNGRLFTADQGLTGQIYHRVGGPAYTGPNGSEWHLAGERSTGQEEYWKALEKYLG